MNTSKQVNVMIGLLGLLVLILGAYTVNEGRRQAHAAEEISERNMERGSRLFVNNCRGCHGLEGHGPEEGAFAPPLNTEAFLIIPEDNDLGVPATPAGEADGVRAFLRNTIACGRTGTFMPTWSQQFGGPLSPTQVDQIVEMITTPGGWEIEAEINEEHIEEVYPDLEHEAAVEAEREGVLVTGAQIAQLQQTQANCGQYTGETAAQFRNRTPLVAAPEETPPAGETPAPGGGGGDLVALGRQLATQNGCAGCHSTTGAALVGPSWRGIVGRQTALADGSNVAADKAYITESIRTPNAKVVRGFQPNIMPAFASLTDEQIDAIFAYMESLR